MERKVEVAIIGAGTAGLNAMGQAKRAGKDFVLINGGELGTLDDNYVRAAIGVMEGGDCCETYVDAA